MRLLVAIISASLLPGMGPLVRLEQDVEPNSSCLQAQDLGPADVVVQGQLDARDDPPRSDVDVFTFSATPGTSVTVSSEWPLFDALVGVSDERCRLFDIRSGVTELDLRVPPSGGFGVRLADPTDGAFNGRGTRNMGPYRIRVEPTPPFARAIGGRLVDAPTGAPLAGADADLLRCDSTGCVLQASRTTDDQGAFRFERGFLDQRLRLGTYQVVGRALGHQAFASAERSVGEAEVLDLGDLPLPES